MTWPAQHFAFATLGPADMIVSAAHAVLAADPKLLEIFGANGIDLIEFGELGRFEGLPRLIVATTATDRQPGPGIFSEKPIVRVRVRSAPPADLGRAKVPWSAGLPTLAGYITHVLVAHQQLPYANPSPPPNNALLATRVDLTGVDFAQYEAAPNAGGVVRDMVLDYTYTCRVDAGTGRLLEIVKAGL